MSLFFRTRLASEQRALSFQEAFGQGLSFRGGTKAGVRVTPDTAMRQGAMWSAVNLLAGVVSTMPIDVFRGVGPHRQEVGPQPPLIASPSTLVSRREWVHQAMVSLLLRGNAYGLITGRDAFGRPCFVEWLDPSKVMVTETSSLAPPSYAISGKPVGRNDIVHLRGFVKPGSSVGMSPVEYHAESIGVGIAARQFGSQWFGDGGHPSALLQNKAKTLDSASTAKVKKRFLSMMRGNREPLVLGADWTYTPIQVTANESQFLEAMGYTDAQVARIFGPGVAEVLGYETGGSMTYTNREQRSLDFLTFAVQQWIVKFEDALTAMIEQPQFVKFNTSSLLRSDAKTRWEIHQIARTIGAHSVDDIREFEDEKPLPDGLGQDYTPLKTAPVAPTPGGPTNGNT